MWFRHVFFGVASAWLAVGCSAGAALTTTADKTTPTTDTSGDDDDDSTATTGPPPEDEDDLLLLPPAQTDVYVFVANPARDTVSRIEVRTRRVDTTEVGARPEVVLATADRRRAVVLNRGDHTVSILEAATLEQRVVPVRAQLNTMTLSPDGRWAVLLHDPALDEEEDGTDGLQSFSEASFVDLEAGVHHPMAVGYDPKQVRFTPDGRLAVIVSDAHLARVELDTLPLVPDLIELAPGVLVPPSAEEVLLAEDGSFAWVRQFGATELLVVDLATGVSSTVAAGGNPTDLDLSPDGAQAVAVARDSHELWVYDAQDPTQAPEVLPLPPTGFGSLVFDPSGARAVVYTTATPTERYAVWDRQAGTILERALVKPVSSMAITPTGDTLLVFHTLADGPDTDPQFEREWALTLVDLTDTDRSNPLLLPAEPLGYANSTAGDLGYFVMEDSAFFEVLDYTTLLHEQVSLPSLPVFLGVLPDLDPDDGDAPPAWVSQDHPLGRISFYDPDGGSVETLTGFELNGGIDDE